MFDLLLLVFLSGVSACRAEVNLFITAPKELEALTGSCLRIPCSFRTNFRHSSHFNNTRTIFAVWMKDNVNFAKNSEKVIFNSSKGSGEPISMIGDLKNQSCTTLFKFSTTQEQTNYFFRIENGIYRATASDDPVKIKVKDSPPNPAISITGDVNDLKENETLTVTCSAPTPCPRSPPQLTWNLQQDARNYTEENSDGTFTTKIQTTITLSHADDGNNISCSGSYPVNGGRVNTSEAEMMLSVSYAPKETSASISPLGLVSAGSSVNLSCSSRAKPPISSYSWFKISKNGTSRVSEGHFYSFNVTDAAVYYCVAENQLGNQTSPKIHLTVAEREVSALLIIAVLMTIGVGFIVLVLFVWWFQKRQTRVQTQSSAAFSSCAGKDNHGEEEAIHYGEINFQPIQRPAGSVQDDEQPQDTVYAQVKVHGSSTPGAHGVSEDLYAQVKKKEFTVPT